jgi:hypothetical protein
VRVWALVKLHAEADGAASVVSAAVSCGLFISENIPSFDYDMSSADVDLPSLGLPGGGG